jgi:2-polyprenyl-3-methyl-5-hydroxy-6-metoxy-1,4-benzoquinol methylase
MSHTLPSQEKITPMLTFWKHITVRDLAFYKRSWFAEAAQSRGKVLDIPAGHGKDAKNLHELGYEVVPADLFPERFEQNLEGVECAQADMTERFPFNDDTFDYLLNSEGIEHLPDQFAFLEECYRVLKPGGKLVITTPNLLSLRARMAFLLTGNRAFKSFVDEVTSVWGYDGKRLYHGHAFLINYFQLRYMLWHTGFRVKEVVGTRYSVSSLMFSPLVPFIWWFTRKTMRKAQKKNPRREIYKEISRDVFSQAMLLSANLFVVAEAMSEEERTGPVCVPHHAKKLLERMEQTAEE